MTATTLPKPMTERDWFIQRLRGAGTTGPYGIKKGDKFTIGGIPYPWEVTFVGTPLRLTTKWFDD